MTKASQWKGVFWRGSRGNPLCEPILSEQLGAGLCALVVDDEPVVGDFLSRFLEGLGVAVVTASTLGAARVRSDAQDFDLFFVDKHLPDGSGIDFVKELTERPYEHEVVVVTAQASVESAVDAIRLGVADYWPKPFADLEELEKRLTRVIASLIKKRRNSQLLAELQAKNRALESLVARDAVTGLQTHAYLLECLDREFERFRRTGAQFALIVIDVDNLGELNDNYGPAIGDKVLRTIAGTVTGERRVGEIGFTPRVEEIAGRFGGDEVALLLPQSSKSDAAERAEQIRKDIVAHDFAGEGLPQVTVSIGFAAAPDDGRHRHELVLATALAVQAGKEAGRNRIVGYEPSLANNIHVTTEREREARERPSRGEGFRKDGIARLAALDRSIAQRSFQFHYQPIVDSHSGVITAYEALCRPTDPVFSSPLELIHASETAGRVLPLGQALREVAVAPIGRLPAETLLFVNIHPLEVGDRLLDPKLESAMVAVASRIVLEVTEGAALGGFDKVRSVLKRLKALGFRIALDDLGAGYAGLNSLALLEPDFIKLDMAMLRGIGLSSRSARLVRRITEFADGEGMRVIGEGIETAEERAVVTDLGCHMLQGYFFSRPAPPFVSVEIRSYS